jgi:hypothetical protein
MRRRIRPRSGREYQFAISDSEYGHGARTKQKDGGVLSQKEDVACQGGALEDKWDGDRRHATARGMALRGDGSERDPSNKLFNVVIVSARILSPDGTNRERTVKVQEFISELRNEHNATRINEIYRPVLP